MSSCVDGSLSQISQTDITFSDCTAKYLPLEKVYFHILEKIQEAFLDLRNWDCSFNKDVSKKTNVTPRDSIIRRACKRPLSNDEPTTANNSNHVELPAKILKEESSMFIRSFSTLPVESATEHSINSCKAETSTIGSVRTPLSSFIPPSLDTGSPLIGSNLSIRSFNSPDSTEQPPKGMVGVLDAHCADNTPKNLAKNPQPLDFSLINPFLTSALTDNKKLENIQLDDLNSLRSALTNAIKQSTENNNITSLAKSFLANHPNSSTRLQTPIFPLQDLNLADLMSQTTSFKLPQVTPPATSHPSACQQIEDTDTNPKTELLSSGNEPKEKLHQCPYCDTKFNQKSNLKTHVFGVHQFKLSTCRTCKIITSKEKLKEHMKTHPNRGYKCHQCDTSFDTHIRLLRHMKIHSSERPYKCSYCPKSFVYKWNLTEHVRIHTGEKPFVCRMCGKGFCQSSTLKRHSLAMHTMDKPYKCSQCKESFVRILLLKKHFVNHHMGPANVATSSPTSIVATPATHPMTPHPMSGGLTPSTTTTATTTAPDALSMLHMLNNTQL